MAEIIRSDDADKAALRVINKATSGASAGISIKSANTSTAALKVRGAGPLIDVVDANGTSKLAVANNGNITMAGSLSGVTTLGSTGDQTVTSGNVIVATAGKGLNVKEGTNARMGTGTLNGATEVTVSTTAVTATSRIFLSIQAPGGTPSGQIYVSSRNAGTSFGVKSVALDTSTFAWMIVEPSA